MKLMDLFRHCTLAGAGLLWSACASADLPKLSGGSASNDVMADVKNESGRGRLWRSGDMCHRLYCSGDFLREYLSQNRGW